MFYSFYFNSCVLSDFKETYYCTCSLVAPLVPEMFFWLAETRKNSSSLRSIHVFHLMLKFCSDINEGIGIQFLLHFVILVKIVASFIRLSFLICGSGFRLKISRIALLRKMFAIGVQNCFDRKWSDSGIFCWNMPCFVFFISVWTEICQKCSNFFF